jgi:hypothetical protein
MFTQRKIQQELLAMQQLYKNVCEKTLKDFNNFDLGAGI